ncbi:MULTISPECIES: T9SS type A sorting domain-containing protein [Proteiniphilum]|jgi:hypothetical protein|uniref:T9SS type A sorting domain-containing protein n=1 Tax=Proteiniphilum TaxID=294702 RepID=UPI001EE9EAFA|nr:MULTISPECIES: T9SS type A sorting domain-containing protein [Proteiniphilum]ULB35427.1 T9SS type A sorting domain-containing protein [Proteiniphilum propionicum]
MKIIGSIIMATYLICWPVFTLDAQESSNWAAEMESRKDNTRRFIHKKPIKEDSGKIVITEAQKNNSGWNITGNAQKENLNRLNEKEESQDETIIKLVENRLKIENLPENSLLEIFNIMGVKVYNRRINAGTNEYTLALPRGYYIIKIGKITKKVAIK